MNTNTTYTVYPKGTLKCPCCKTNLYFELAVDMRVKRADKDGNLYYDSYCPNKQCETKGEHAKVLAPKD